MAENEKIKLAKEVVTQLYQTAKYYEGKFREQEQALEGQQMQIRQLQRDLEDLRAARSQTEILMGQMISDKDRELADKDRRISELKETQAQYLKNLLDCSSNIHEAISGFQKGLGEERIRTGDQFTKILASMIQLQKDTAAILKAQAGQVPQSPEEADTKGPVDWA